MPTMQMPTMAPWASPCPPMCYPGFAPTMPAHLVPPPNVFQPLGSPGAAAPAQTFQQPIDAAVVDLTAMDDSDVPVERTPKRARASKAGGSTTKGVVHVQRLVLPDDIGERLLDMHPDEQRRLALKEKYDEVLASGSKEQVKLGGDDLKKILAARVELPPATVVDGARHVENLENKLRTRLGPTDPRRARPNARYDGLGEARESQIKFDKVMTEAYLSLTEGMPKKDAAELIEESMLKRRQIFGAAGHLKNLFRRRVAPAGAPRSGARGAQGSQKDQRGVCGSLRIVATTENIPKRGPKGAKISFLMAKNRRAEKLTAARRRWVRPTIDRARDRQARLRCP